MILQSHIIPQQGMDPMQAKMMKWMLPAIFTVMMLFLPAALGVYMLTNSVLGIAQQLVIERIAPRAGTTPRGGDHGQAGGPGLEATGRIAAPFGKGKTRV